MDNDGNLYVVNEDGGGDVEPPAALGLRAVDRRRTRRRPR